MADQKSPDGMHKRTDKIKLKATDGHPYRKEGEVFEVHPSQEKMLKERQWAVDENAKTTKAENAAKPVSVTPGAQAPEAPQATEAAAATTDGEKKK